VTTGSGSTVRDAVAWSKTQAGHGIDDNRSTNFHGDGPAWLTAENLGD
jgi:hypothetical protein